MKNVPFGSVLIVLATTFFLTLPGCGYADKSQARLQGLGAGGSPQTRAQGPVSGRQQQPSRTQRSGHSAGATWITQAVDGPGLNQRIIESRAAGTRVSLHVYTPPQYNSEPSQRYPVIYWLHGTGSPTAGIRPISQHFNRAIQEGRIPPVIVVFPNGLTNGMWVNSKDGSAPLERMVIEELIPRVDRQLRTIPTPEGRIVEGFSMGGYGAARLGLKYPEIFGGISVIGGGPLQQDLDGTPRAGPREQENLLATVYGGDMDYFRSVSPWSEATRAVGRVTSRTRIRIVVGEQDEVLPANEQFHEHLKSLGIKHDFVVLPQVGHHPMEVFDALGSANWDFYRAVFGSHTLRSQR